MVTVKMSQTTYFEGTHYAKDKEYEIDKETAIALGSFAIPVEKMQKAPKNKMLTDEDQQVKKK